MPMIEIMQTVFAHWKKIAHAARDNREVWMPIGSTRYSVSSTGNVRNTETGRILKTTLSRGYPRVGLCLNRGDLPKFYRVHRLVAEAFLVNIANKPHIDHINNNRSDNRANNLRYATPSENQRNKPAPSNNTSGIVGVDFKPSANKWRASISVDNVPRHLGYFVNRDQAIAARIAASNEFFGAYNHDSQKSTTCEPAYDRVAFMRNRLLEDFTFSSGSADVVKSSDLEEWRKQSKIDVNMGKISSELIQLGCLPVRTNKWRGYQGLVRKQTNSQDPPMTEVSG